MRRNEMDDEELGRLIRALDPARHLSEDELAERQERTWARITAAINADAAGADRQAPGRRTRRARLWWGVSLPALAAALVAVVVVLVVNPFAVPAPAAAQGLPPLRYEASDLTLEQHLERARDRLAESPGPAEPLREATTIAWYAHITMDGPDKGTVISPEVMTTTWEENLDMRIKVTAGRSYVVGEGEQPPTREDLAPEGSVLRDDQIPGEQMMIDGEPLPFLVPGSGLDFYRAYVAEAVAMSEGDTTGALRAVEDLLNHWTLTNAQQADLLSVLGEYPELRLLGLTQDRAGREVFGLSAVSGDGGHEEVLLVSSGTGHIVASETIYLDDDPEVPLPTGSVMSYQLWGVDPDTR
ncbi:hypothetical protein HF576_00180 [Microbacterium sp. CFH 90308]|uniref:Uncharacterized protein n=1 Tax=Microbacterium salsuginis TaxID=2722803 RepID=A0ABX1K5K6_9MICO|nr:hypothetical protein [Microbacterium sp. CFH 90308]NLP82257.1 hypothetical protein [Microbacterium sp. CFH 90308]